ncbi:hypothetical protein FXN61_41475 [Lentzea sp. PSKA42]|uniref:Uncharacterized protein n=1 Tax=Lentzea indica TaxID=2604800 RepID=A0ABX1FWK4_9PSEU|nr:hypothetical protein [Lentzea indica]NKE62851.1 hypothetical protein [Lentzea indica]
MTAHVSASPVGKLDGEIVALRDGRLDFCALTGTPRGRVAAGITIYLSPSTCSPKATTTSARRSARTAAAARPVHHRPGPGPRLDAARGLRCGHRGLPDQTTRPALPGWTQRGLDQGPAHRVVDAVVIGVTGNPSSPAELLLARPDASGELRRIGLSQPLSPTVRAQAGPHLDLTGEPPVRVSTGQFGSRGETEYKPVHPRLVVEVEAEGFVHAFTNRLRPTVHRVRPDLTLADLQSET